MLRSAALRSKSLELGARSRAVEQQKERLGVSRAARPYSLAAGSQGDRFESFNGSPKNRL